MALIFRHYWPRESTNVSRLWEMSIIGETELIITKTENTHTHGVVFPSLQRTLCWLTFISWRLTLTLNQVFTLKSNDYVLSPNGRRVSTMWLCEQIYVPSFDWPQSLCALMSPPTGLFLYRISLSVHAGKSAPHEPTFASHPGILPDFGFFRTDLLKKTLSYNYQWWKVTKYIYSRPHYKYFHFLLLNNSNPLQLYNFWLHYIYLTA